MTSRVHTSGSAHCIKGSQASKIAVNPHTEHLARILWREPSHPPGRPISAATEPSAGSSRSRLAKPRLDVEGPHVRVSALHLGVPSRQAARQPCVNNQVSSEVLTPTINRSNVPRGPPRSDSPHIQEEAPKQNIADCEDRSIVPLAVMKTKSMDAVTRP